MRALEDVEVLGIDPIGEPRSAEQVLEWSRGLVKPALRRAVDRLSSPVRHIAGYHLGWWDAEGSPSLASGGKGIRPALALLCAEAVGAPAGVAVPAAVAVELVHNFSLLHDDVMDRDESRRHRLTAWRVFGVAEAILAGDAMVTLAVEVLAAAAPGVGAMPVVAGAGPGSSAVVAELIVTLCASIQALVEGQMDDVSFESRTDVGLSECLQMARNKTGALLSAACRLGAQAGGGSTDQVEALTAFGAELGLAFQVNDDLLGIWGDPQTTGKADYSDLRNRKKSLPVVAALASGTAASRRLEEWFASTSEPTADDVERVAAWVEEGGGRDWGRERLAALRSLAIDDLRRARPAVASAAELTTLVAMVTAAAAASPAASPKPGMIRFR